MSVEEKNITKKTVMLLKVYFIINKNLNNKEVFTLLQCRRMLFLSGIGKIYKYLEKTNLTFKKTNLVR